MTATAAVLTSVLGTGGLLGLAALLRLRTDKDATVVDTVSKSVLVLERLNDRLEADLADEHAARVAAEAKLDELRRQQGYPTQPGEPR